MRAATEASTTTRTIGDRYELENLIAAGGMGEVHAARDTRLDRRVAVKLLYRGAADAFALREARAAARLSHPNVVAVFDAGEDAGQPFIVMELLAGRTLADELGAGPLSPDAVRELGRQVLAALGEAHEHGIVHRDVKPGNILLASGTWKVADFGIATSAAASGASTPTTELIGSPSYIAPERLVGLPASPGSDLYSLGVVMYEALTGRRPFEGDGPLSIATAASAGRFTPVRALRPDVEPALGIAIERAMKRRPIDRFATARDMAEALAAPTTDELTSRTSGRPSASEITAPLPTAPEARPIERPGRARRRTAPRRGLGAFVVLVVASALLVTGALAVRGHPGPVGRGASVGGTTSPSASLSPPSPTSVSGLGAPSGGAGESDEGGDGSANHDNASYGHGSGKGKGETHGSHD